MRKGDIREIEVDGIKTPMAFLGKGFFTAAWKDGESVVLISSDPLKEALALFADQSLPHVPKIERLECDRRDGSQAYRMPLYTRLSAAKHKDAWKIYKALEKAWTAVAYKPPYDSRLAIDKSEKILDDLIVSGAVPVSVTDALREMLDAASNYGQGIALEFAPRNLAVDSNGQLILLDVMFDAERLSERQPMKPCTLPG